MDFNNIQKQLVERCERLHEEGIRHKGLSGIVCEKLLLGELRKSFPNINFSTGMIKFCQPEKKGADIKTGKKDECDMSSQIDIIIYKEKPIFESEEIVIVHINQVIGIIEVKKWTYPKMLESSIEKLEKIKKILNEKSMHEIPIFYVTFRFHRNDFNIWSEKIKGIEENNNIKFYCFYGGGAYPWYDEENWENFKISNPYANQYEKLVKDIQKIEL